MKTPIRVSDQIYPAHIDMATGELIIDRSAKRTVSEVYEIETDYFGTQQRYKCSNGFIFGETTCVLAREADREKIENEDEIRDALNDMLRGITTLKVKLPIGLKQSTSDLIQNLEYSTITVFEKLKKQYRINI